MNLKDIYRDFDKDGYVIIENVLTGDECKQLKGELEADYLRYKDFYFGAKQQSEDGLVNKENEKVVFNLHNKNIKYFQLINHPTVRAVLDIVLKDGSYKNAEPYILTNSSARSPLKGTEGQQLHIDCRLPGSHFPLMVIALWMLDDFSPENGATRVVPGSHRNRAFPENHQKYEEEVVVNAPKGSVLIFNGGIWHGSSKKILDDTRWGVILSYGRWFLKPSFDLYRNMPQSIYEQLSEDEKTLMGYKARPPIDEFTRNRRLSDKFEDPEDYFLPE